MKACRSVGVWVGRHVCMCLHLEFALNGLQEL